MTLCWPEHPNAWEPFVTPAQWRFENFTPTLYGRNRPFKSEWSQVPSNKMRQRVCINKVIRWKQHTIYSHHPEQIQGLRKYFRAKTWQINYSDNLRNLRFNRSRILPLAVCLHYPNTHRESFMRRSPRSIILDLPDHL